MVTQWRMLSRHKSLWIQEEVEAKEIHKEVEVEVEEDLNMEEVGTLEEVEANRASRDKNQSRARVNLKLKGMTNLIPNAITVRSMVIMLESVGRSKGTMLSPMQATL